MNESFVAGFVCCAALFIVFDLAAEWLSRRAQKRSGS